MDTGSRFDGSTIATDGRFDEWFLQNNACGCFRNVADEADLDVYVDHCLMGMIP